MNVSFPSVTILILYFRVYQIAKQNGWFTQIRIALKLAIGMKQRINQGYKKSWLCQEPLKKIKKGIKKQKIYISNNSKHTFFYCRSQSFNHLESSLRSGQNVMGWVGNWAMGCDGVVSSVEWCGVPYQRSQRTASGNSTFCRASPSTIWHMCHLQPFRLPAKWKCCQIGSFRDKSRL